MCLTKPGKVIEIHSNDPLIARVDFTSSIKAINVEKFPDIKVGDYILAHSGSAMNLLDEEDAKRTLKILWGVEH